METISHGELAGRLLRLIQIDRHVEHIVIDSLNRDLLMLNPVLPEVASWYAAATADRTAEARLLAREALVIVKTSAGPEEGLPKPQTTVRWVSFRDLFPIELTFDGHTTDRIGRGGLKTRWSFGDVPIEGVSFPNQGGEPDDGQRFARQLARRLGG